MPLFQTQVDNQKAMQDLPVPAIIVNDLNMVSEEDQALVEQLIVTTFKGDKVTMLPQCQCQATKGVFSRKTFCDLCHTEVVSQMTSDVFSHLWFRAPQTVDTLISPHYWLRIKALIGRAGFCALSYLTNTTYTPGNREPAVIGSFLKAGITNRGLNYFCRNMFEILQAISGMREYKPKQRQFQALLEEMKANKEAVFTQYIPLPNKSVLVIEANSLGIFIDDAVAMAKNAMKLMIGIDTLTFVRNKENRTAKALDAISEMYSEYIDKNLRPKPGILRKQVAGTRTNWAFRNGLISITGTHDYDEMHAPWCSAIVTLGHHLKGKLMKRGWCLNDASDLLIRHTHKFHPLISELFDELLAEANGAIPGVAQRNPSLLVGSAQEKRMTQICRDPLNRAMATSILSAKAMNADYDGDFLTALLSLDKQLAEVFKPLGLETSLYNFNKPHGISGLMSLPKPNVSSIANWLDGN